MAPSSTNFTSRYFSLALFLLVAVATTTRVVHAADTETSYQDDADAQAAKTMAKHEESDFLSRSTLEQVHVITRHGARTMNPKDSDTLAEQGGVTLTAMGQQQLYDLGVWLQNEYIDELGDPQTDGVRSLQYYNPNFHHFEASNLDRTLTSANALAKGLFPGTMRASGSHKMDPSDPLYEETVLFESPAAVPIPVYTTGSDINDVTLQAFKNCPEFQRRLKKDLYPSAEWKSLETQYEDLLVKLARWFPEMAEDGKVPLKEVWNAYDALHVARTECFDNTATSCEAFLSTEDVRLAASALTSADFERLEGLTEHTEFLKFGAGLDTDPSLGTATAGPLGGSNLLWKILNRSKGDGHFFLYSANFPLLLGLLSTLQASTDFWNVTGEKFFEYGSALIVEIHKSKDKGQRYFVLKYKSSEDTDSVNVIIKESSTGIKCGDDDSGLPMIPKASWCLLEEVETWADIYTLKSEEAWCKACNNQEADVCMAKKGRSRGTPMIDTWAANSKSMGYTNAPGAVAVICSLFFGGFFAGVLLMTLVWKCSSGGIGKSVSTDAYTSSYDGEDEKDGEVVEIDGTYGSSLSDSHKSAEKLNNKEIC